MTVDSAHELTADKLISRIAGSTEPNITALSALFNCQLPSFIFAPYSEIFFIMGSDILRDLCYNDTNEKTNKDKRR